MPNALAQQILALAAEAAEVLVRAVGSAGRRTDAAVAPTPSHQRAQKHLAIDGVRFPTKLATVDRDGGGNDDLASDAMRDEQSVQSEAIEPGLLHPDDRHRGTHPLLDPTSQTVQQVDARGHRQR